MRSRGIEFNFDSYRGDWAFSWESEGVRGEWGLSGVREVKNY